MATSRTHALTFEDDVIDRLARIEEQARHNGDRAADVETRVRSLERRQWLIAGVAMSAGPLLSKLGIHIPDIT